MPVAELVVQDRLQVVAAQQPGRPVMEEGQRLGDLLLVRPGIPQHLLDPVGLLLVGADTRGGQADHGRHLGGHGGSQRADPAALTRAEQGDAARVHLGLALQTGGGGQRLLGPVLEALVAPVAAGAAATRLVPGQAGEARAGQRLRLAVPAVPLGRARPVHERYRRMRPATAGLPEGPGQPRAPVVEGHVYRSASSYDPLGK